MILTLNKEIILTGASLEIKNQLKKALSFPNPAYLEAKRHKRYTGNIEKTLCFLEKDQDSIRLPRGFIRQALEIVGKEFIFQDHRQILPVIDLQFSGKLRPYQEKAVQAIIKKDFGVLSALTGSGKTICALAIIAIRRQPVLILVHSKLLLYQWRDMIAKFLGTTAGLIGDNKFDVQPVTVGIINSVRKHLKELPRHFGQIIFDETHKIPAMMSCEIVRAFDCKFALGCSATPYRRDQLTRLIHWFIGPMVHRIDSKELEDLGAVLIPEIQTRETGFNYQKLLSLIVVDEDRNDMIVQDVLFETRHYSGTVLVVSDRVEHCEILAKALAINRSLRVEILTGQLKSKERMSIVEDIRAGKVDVVIATVQLIGEGVDFPCLSSLFLATPIKFSARLIQVIGRILRPVDGKKPHVYDYCDPVGPLYASAKARAKTYRDMGWLK
ncbi:DEAD/DEAH box helicase [candidate division WOR-3 bacterium]|nr:DEAD/DEAH box helicase [candidate division WOR-3 bacterium]